MDKKFLSKNHFHFIGIGGIGMSGIAMALLKKGFSISGSDLVRNGETKKLEENGALIFDSQIEKNIEYGFRPEAGEVVLTYSDTTGSHRKLNFDLGPDNNGQIIVFPSDINHCVYPTHTTDEYRLSVAGDISLSSLDIHEIIDPEADPRV